MQSNSFIRLFFTLGTLGLSACSRHSVQVDVESRKASPPESAHVAPTKEEAKVEIPKQLSRDPKANKITVQSLENLDREALFPALRGLARERTPEAVNILKEFLASEAKRLPETMPKEEEMVDFERNPRTDDHWFKHIGKISAALDYLIRSDTEEGRRAGKGFVDQFKAKHGNTEAGAALLNLFNQVLESAQGDVDLGIAPWKVEPRSLEHDRKPVLTR